MLKIYLDIEVDEVQSGQQVGNLRGDLVRVLRVNRKKVLVEYYWLSPHQCEQKKI